MDGNAQISLSSKHGLGGQ